MRTSRTPSALVALYHRGIASTILKQYCLFATLKCLAHSLFQLWRKQSSHYLTTPEVLSVHHIYMRQFEIAITLFEFHQMILALLSIIIAFC
jgi:hypothetical protein